MYFAELFAEVIHGASIGTDARNDAPRFLKLQILGPGRDLYGRSRI